MSEFVQFILTVIIVTSPAVFAPGPLTISAIHEGSKSGAKSGLLMAIGHTVVEFPLVFLLGLGLFLFQ